MKIAIIGLGKMGSQIAQKLHKKDQEVIVFNRTLSKVDSMVSKFGLMGAHSKEEVVNYFGSDQPVVWMMISADSVDLEISEWLKLLPPKSIIIDGGNSKFSETIRRAKIIKEKGCYLVDVGTSGGVWGYQNGFSMMVGGEKEVVQKIDSILEILSMPSGGYEYFGGSGSGHYVKMVHNAIEYGIMESLAEGYRLLKEGPYKNLDLYKAANVWQKQSVISSWLNELTRDFLKVNPELTNVDGYVTESGEARWALEIARELKIEMPAIQSSFDVRINSQKGKVNFATKILASMRNAFGGHKINK